LIWKLNEIKRRVNRLKEEKRLNVEGKGNYEIKLSFVCFGVLFIHQGDSFVQNETGINKLGNCAG